MALSETVPKLQEKLLDKPSRKHLMDELLRVAENKVPPGVLLVEYLPILAITTYILESKSGEMQIDRQLEPAMVDHLQKMAALESRNLPVSYEDESSRAFWEAVKFAAGSKWDMARSFEHDLSNLPKTWQAAANDLATLETKTQE